MREAQKLKDTWACEGLKKMKWAFQTRRPQESQPRASQKNKKEAARADMGLKSSNFPKESGENIALNSQVTPVSTLTSSKVEIL